MHHDNHKNDQEQDSPFAAAKLLPLPLVLAGRNRIQRLEQSREPAGRGAFFCPRSVGVGQWETMVPALSLFAWQF